jgi:rhamnulokinase
MPRERLYELTGIQFLDTNSALLARACTMPVIAGPMEATSIGNLLIQAQAMGGIAPGTLRQVVRASEPPRCVGPEAAFPLVMVCRRSAR